MPRLAIDSLKGETLFYREKGSDTSIGAYPVLFLHRAGGSSRSWIELMETLDGRCHMLAIDLPGHGKSAGPALESIESMADCAAHVLDALGYNKVLVVGHSMGGAVALSMALNQKHARKISALLLISSGARLRVATPILDSLRNNFELLPQVMSQFVFGPATPTDVTARLREELFDASGDVVLTDMEACNGFDVESRLKEISVPIHALVGKEDFLTPPRLMRRLTERVSVAQLRVISGAGHMLPQERPDVVTESILELVLKNEDSNV